MRLALIQFDPLWEDEAENLARLGPLIAEAASGGAAIVALPEMCTTGFSMNPPKGDATNQALASYARTHGAGIIAGHASCAPGCENLASAYDGTGRRVARYSKINPFTMAQEHMRYASGRQAVAFELAGLRASAFICYDLRFPEVARSVATAVDAIFYLANWPASRALHWTILLRARAIENQCYVIGVNRTGVDGAGIAYEGGSVVYGPSGEPVAECGSGAGVYHFEIEPRTVAKARADYPFLRDMKS